MLKVYQLRLNQNTFEVALKYKGVSVRVAFEGGNVYNSTFARCYTRDPFKQRAIENSVMFKTKEIILERQVEEASDRQPKVQVRTRRVAKPAGTVVMPKKPAGKPQGANEPQPAGDGKDAAEMHGADGIDTTHEPAPTQEPTGGDGGESGIKVFDSLDEAILFVAQEYNEQLTEEKDVRDFLKAHGINPRIKKG